MELDKLDKLYHDVVEKHVERRKVGKKVRKVGKQVRKFWKKIRKVGKKQVGQEKLGKKEELKEELQLIESDFKFLKNLK